MWSTAGTRPCAISISWPKSEANENRAPRCGRVMYIVSMPDVRYLRAGPRALPLLQDLHEQTLAPLPPDVAAMWADDFADLLLESEEPSTVYILGFADHSPLGYVKCSVDDLTMEISGPFLYPEFSSASSATGLLDQVCELARFRERRLIYCMCPQPLLAVREALGESGFEEVSSEREFIKRWRDGLLADHLLAENCLLFALLLED